MFPHSHMRLLCSSLCIALAATAAHAQHEHEHGGDAPMPSMPGMTAMTGMSAMTMSGAYGPYPMSREASGTSWLPDSSPDAGVMLMAGDWHVMVHGFVDAVYDHQGGPRGDTKSFSESMLMGMAQRGLGGGTLGARAMVSLDPLMGKAGYPLLFQTGETANGVTPLIDRQHPHNLFMELAGSYSMPIADASSVFVYAGLPGEPALGPPAFMHRFSGIDNPEAPITHHWLDSTHITNGVVTVGVVRDRIKIEGSVFHGREPDQFRYRIEAGRLDSASARFSFNPDANWSLQVSHGYLKSPESLSPQEDVRRTTASATWNRPLAAGNWQTTLAWGRNANRPGRTLDGVLLESAMSHGAHTFFGRVERVEKDELFEEDTGHAGEAFRVGKLSLGYVHDFSLAEHLKLGIGGLASAYAVPSALEESYGRHPTSYMLFARLKLD